MLLTPEELREQLKVVREEPALVVMLVDLLDASGSFLGAPPSLVATVEHAPAHNPLSACVPTRQGYAFHALADLAAGTFNSLLQGVSGTWWATTP